MRNKIVIASVVTIGLVFYLFQNGNNNDVKNIGSEKVIKLPEKNSVSVQVKYTEKSLKKVPHYKEVFNNDNLKEVERIARENVKTIEEIEKNTQELISKTDELLKSHNIKIANTLSSKYHSTKKNKKLKDFNTELSRLHAQFKGIIDEK